MKVEEFISLLSRLEPELELVFFDGLSTREVEAVEKTRLPEEGRVVVWLEE